MNNINNIATNILALLTGYGILVILILLILALPIIIVCLIAQWKLFKKAGKKGWEIFIPFYNTWILIEISGLNWWYFLIIISGNILSFVGIEELLWLTNIASYFVSFQIYYNIAKKTKQNEILYGVLGIFIPIVPILIFGFSKNINFDNSIVVNPNGIIGNINNQSKKGQNNTQEKYCLGCGKNLNNNVKFCENCGKKVEK